MAIHRPIQAGEYRKEVPVTHCGGSSCRHADQLGKLAYRSAFFIQEWKLICARLATRKTMPAASAYWGIASALRMPVSPPAKTRIARHVSRAAKSRDGSCVAGSPLARFFLSFCTSLVGAVMCPACYASFPYAAGHNAFRASQVPIDSPHLKCTTHRGFS
jgi:hypothetical protein